VQEIQNVKIVNFNYKLKSILKKNKDAVILNAIRVVAIHSATARIIVLPNAKPTNGPAVTISTITTILGTRWISAIVTKLRAAIWRWWVISRIATTTIVIWLTITAVTTTVATALVRIAIIAWIVKRRFRKHSTKN
jgi:hypothetical protein